MTVLLLWLVACTGPSSETGDTGEPLPDEPRELSSEVILGEGGFFGVAGQPAGTRGSFMVGAHYAGADQAGRVYVFEGVPSSSADAVEVLAVPDGVPAGLGWGLAAACDLDRDGISDLAVGQHLYLDPDAANCGRVLVFMGDGSTVELQLPDGVKAKNDVLGQTVTCADLDGDDLPELIATGQNAGVHDTGVAAIWKGTGSAPSGDPDEILEPTLALSQQYLGAAVVVGDLDTDDDTDLAVGAWGLMAGSEADHTGGVLVWDDAVGLPASSLFPLA